MEHLIQFRKLISELSPTESDLFVHNFISEFGNDFIISAIFSHLCAPILEGQPQNNQVSDMIKIVRDIVESRNNVRMNEVSFTIAELPSELIGKTASFLRTKEYLSFQQTNRDIYIACNSPLQMQTLDFRHVGFITNEVNWTKYSAIKTCEITFNDIVFAIEPFDDKILFKNLDTLIIDFQSQDLKQNDVDRFLKFKSINLENIRRLSCRDIGVADDTTGLGFESPAPPFIQFLSAFKNLEYLELCNINLDNDTLFGLQIKWLPYLKGFRMKQCNIFLQSGLILFHSDQIEVLIVDKPLPTDGTVFPKLKELETRETGESLFRILDGTRVIRAMSIHWTEGYSSDKYTLAMDRNGTRVIRAIEFLILQPHLECVEIVCESQELNKICKSIVKGLSFPLKRQNFKIIFCVNGEKEIDLNIVTQGIKAIVARLNADRASDFMVFIKAESSAWGCEEISPQKLQNDIFENKYSVNFYEYNSMKMLVVNTINSQLTHHEEINFFHY